MRTFIVLLLLLPVLTACNTHHQQVSIDPAFQPYYGRFIVDAATHAQHPQVHDLVIQFGNLSGASENGVCVTGNMSPTITIDQGVWAILPDSQRELLVYHELGHCIFFYHHDLAYHTSTMPESIMYPTLFDGDTYESYHEYYLTQFFDGAVL
jgi:hypothetical protein